MRDDAPSRFQLTAEAWDYLGKFWLNMENEAFWQYDLMRVTHWESFYRSCGENRRFAMEMAAKRRLGLETIE